MLAAAVVDAAMPRIVYSRRYNIRFYGIERLHPFGSRKYGRTWKVVRRELGARANGFLVPVDRPVIARLINSVPTTDRISHVAASEAFVLMTGCWPRARRKMRGFRRPRAIQTTTPIITGK